MASFTPRNGLLYLQQLGWSAPAAAGILGNLQHESNFNPTAIHDGGTGYGMAGWRDPSPGQGRKTGLMDFARKAGKDAADPYVQLDFLNHELRTNEAKTGDLLRTAATPAQAATAFLGFERPSGWSAGGDPTKASGYANRVKYAEQIAGGQGADTMYGGGGQDTIPAQTQPNGGNMAGQGLLNVNMSPEVTQGLLAQYEPTTMDRIGTIAGGIGDALIAAGSGNPNWGAAGSAGFRGGAQNVRRQGQQRQQETAMRALMKDNPQLGQLLALGGPEMVGKVLAQQMMPQEQPAAIRTLQALGIDAGTLPQAQKLQLAGINQPEPTKYQTVTDGAGNVFAVDPTNPQNVVPIQGAQPKPEKPDIREVNGRLLAIDQSGARDITPEGLPAKPVDPTNLGKLQAERAALPPGDPRIAEYDKAIEAVGKGNQTTINMPSETGARIGLGDQFLQGDVPAIQRALDAGVFDGVGSRANMFLGRGPQGDIMLRMQTGMEALIRNLTGAGKSREEAESYASQYLPAVDDSTERIRLKLNGLIANLQGVREGAIGAKMGTLTPAGTQPVNVLGGETPAEGIQPAPAPAQPQQNSQVPAFEQMDLPTLSSWIAGNNIRSLSDADFQRLRARAQALEAQ